MNNCLCCNIMTFPNSCSFLRLSEGRLRLHLSKLLCRLYNMQSSGEEFYTEICGAWGNDSDSGGNTCLCVCFAVTWSTGHSFAIAAPVCSQHPALVEPCADSTNGTGLQELLGRAVALK